MFSKEGSSQFWIVTIILSIITIPSVFILRYFCKNILWIIPITLCIEFVVIIHWYIILCSDQCIQKYRLYHKIIQIIGSVAGGLCTILLLTLNIILIISKSPNYTLIAAFIQGGVFIWGNIMAYQRISEVKTISRYSYVPQMIKGFEMSYLTPTVAPAYPYNPIMLIRESVPYHY